MVKVKIKCASCGKSFKSPDAKRTLCPECQAARKAAPAQQRGTQPVTPAAPAGPAIDIRAAFRAAQQAEGNFAAYRPAPPPPEAPVSPVSSGLHSSAPPISEKGSAAPVRPPVVTGPRPARPTGSSAPHPTRPPRPAPPRPPKERKPPTPPFAPSPEQAEAVRNRYLELAQPEFDGIRHQIATELAIPINTVKAIVKELRAQMKLPSWWELSALTLTDEQRAAVRALYLPTLPLPEVGVHRHIAEQLGLRSLAVYTEIGALRDELGLPRFNERPDWPPRPSDDEQAMTPTSPEGSSGGDGRASPEHAADAFPAAQAVDMNGAGAAGSAGPALVVMASMGDSDDSTLPLSSNVVEQTGSQA